MSVTLTAAATTAHSGPIILAAATTAVAALTASVVTTNRCIDEPRHAADTPLDPRDPVHLRRDDVARIGDRLATMVQFKTISWDDFSGDRDAAEHGHGHAHGTHEQHDSNPPTSRPERLAASRAALQGMLEYLRKTYPLVHARLHVERVNTYSLLITWRGSEDGRAPVDSDAWRDPAHGATLFMAHSDVVPVPAGSETKWKYPPFAGHVDEEGFVWGRGVVDCKGNMIILFEAAERLLAAGYWPSRTVYIACGHDEEIGGFAGSAKIAAQLRKRGIESLAMVVDEGTMAVQADVGGLGSDPTRIALIAVAQKGLLTLKMMAHRKSDGSSHAGKPSPDDPVVVLARGITAIEERERRAIFDAGAQWMAQYLVPSLPPMQRLLINNNPSIFRKAVAKVLQTMNTKSLRGIATMQTTIAFTMLEGSPKVNVIPDTATAYMDVRIVAGETVASIIADLREVVARVSPQLTITQWGKTTADPSPISTTAKTDPYYSALTRVLHGMYRTHRTAQEPAFGRVVVAPTILSGTTDTRHFPTLARRIYRTSFFFMWTPEQMAGLHGVNERLQAENIARSVSGMMELMRVVGDMPESDAVLVPVP
ncbi:hypothetical protein GGF31_008079 [Allomyces arbusculus]|nr:hypothetical protein GGF31_008079 [Allomyces arbusculus]